MVVLLQSRMLRGCHCSCWKMFYAGSAVLLEIFWQVFCGFWIQILQMYHAKLFWENRVWIKQDNGQDELFLSAIIGSFLKRERTISQWEGLLAWLLWLCFYLMESVYRVRVKIVVVSEHLFDATAPDAVDELVLIMGIWLRLWFLGLPLRPWEPICRGGG